MNKIRTKILCLKEFRYVFESVITIWVIRIKNQRWFRININNWSFCKSWYNKKQNKRMNTIKREWQWAWFWIKCSGIENSEKIKSAECHNIIVLWIFWGHLEHEKSINTWMLNCIIFRNAKAIKICVLVPDQ